MGSRRLLTPAVTLSPKTILSVADDHQEPALSVGVGVAVHPHSGKTIENLLSAADEALYEAKGRRKDLCLKSAALGKLSAPTNGSDRRDRERP
jgi:predicted signal transduction protein with EAL and GGDEF domain